MSQKFVIQKGGEMPVQEIEGQDLPPGKNVYIKPEFKCPECDKDCGNAGGLQTHIHWKHEKKEEEEIASYFDVEIGAIVTVQLDFGKSQRVTPGGITMFENDHRIPEGFEIKHVQHIPNSRMPALYQVVVERVE